MKMKLQGCLVAALLQARVTLILIVMNIIAFSVPGFYDIRFLDTLAQGSYLINWGGNISALTFSGEYWRLLSSQFVHAGIVHLTMNMLALWSIGSVLERYIPRATYLAIYLLSGVSGGLLSAVYYSTTQIVSCGASAAIIGLAGAFLAYAAVTRNIQNLPVKNLLMSLLLTFGAGMFLPLDNMAHLGGLVFGFVSGGAVVLVSRVWQANRMLTAAMSGGIFALSIAGLWGVYNHFSVPGGAGQVKAVKVINILRMAGLGDSASVMGGLNDLDTCIQTQLATATLNLKSCNRRDLSDNFDIRWIEKRLLNDFAQCRLLVADLEQIYPDKEEQRRLGIVKDFCEAREQLYKAVFTQEIISVDAAKLHEADRRMRNLADRIRLLSKDRPVVIRSIFDYFYTSQNDSEVEDAEDIQSQGVFNDVRNRVYKAVQESRCPYYSCTKQ
jgi:rhomboid protease GluP